VQSDQGKELNVLEHSEIYPEKIRGLMEELRYNKDREMELERKIGEEERADRRQKEHILNLKQSKQ